uniref:AlNc14C58G4336 protein n=1 Tax=Albugo laibachii Nc14 TaxID=890382 RepID=F0WCF6_9STRA|nr:AlNc14C58G4336 [Albugo laibachii Nc14]|eukprot:CCA18871.1 AlNc14C58G4336 [Albugo laibachii Nc14]
MSGDDPIEDQANDQEMVINDLIYRLENPINSTVLVSNTDNIADKSNANVKKPVITFHDSGNEHRVSYQSNILLSEYDDPIDEELKYDQTRIDNLINSLIQPKSFELPVAENATIRSLLGATFTPMLGQMFRLQVGASLCIVVLICAFMISKRLRRDSTHTHEICDIKGNADEGFAYHVFER